MSTEQLIQTVKFLCPELAGRAEARTKAWRDGPPAGWVIAYLVWRGRRIEDIARWWPTVGEDFWQACGLRWRRPNLAEVKKFFALVHEQLDQAPSTVFCLAQIIADLAQCGVGPVARIDPATLKTQRAPKATRP